MPDEEANRQSDYLEITLQDKEVVVMPTTADGSLGELENGETEKEMENEPQQQVQEQQEKRQIKPQQQTQLEQQEEQVQEEKPGQKESNREASKSVKTVITVDKVNGETSESPSTEQLQQLEENQNSDCADGWEVVESDSIPDNMVFSKLSKQASEDGTATTRILKLNESSPELSRSPSLGQRKKKPPPFRPPPYAAKTPPVPPKNRKKVSIKLPTSEEKLKTENWTQLVEEVSSKLIKGATEGVDADTSNEQGSPSNGEQVVLNDHVYEIVEPYQVPTPLLLSRPENLKTKHYSVSSIDSDPSPSSTMKRYESEDTLGALSRAGTMMANEKTTIREIGSRRDKQRPMSLASTSSKELEASFEVCTCVCVCVCVCNLITIIENVYMYIVELILKC